MNLFDEISKLNSRLENLTDNSLNFNKTFAPHGWIATDDTSVPLIQEALQIYVKENIEAAENFLCNSFDDKYFQNHLKRMNAVFVFKDRYELIQLAYDDHKNKRYHASVPVILSQIDGLVHDIADQSFFEQDKKLGIFNFDSQITGFNHELNTIAKKMNKPRNKTNSNPLQYPYRNGILHGRDIKYNTRIVSTKCFFSLFSLRIWALRIQNNEMSKRTNQEYEEIPNFKIGKKLSDCIDKLLSE